MSARRRPAPWCRRLRAVGIAVLLDQRERVALPILASGLDDVDVGNEERLRGSRGARVDGDQPSFLRMLGRGESVSWLSVKPAMQPCRHAFGRQRAASRRQRRNGFDQLLEDLSMPIGLDGGVATCAEAVTVNAHRRNRDGSSSAPSGDPDDRRIAGQAATTIRRVAWTERGQIAWPREGIAGTIVT